LSFLLLFGALFLGLELITLISIGIILVNQLALVVFHEQLESARPISLVLCTRMCGDSDDSNTVEGRERVILELLRDRPRDQVTRGSNASLHVFLDRLLGDVTFEADLDCTEDVWQRLLLLVNGSHKNENLMCWGVGKKEQVIRSVFVVRGHED
jgi:hypothetical protein